MLSSMDQQSRHSANPLLAKIQRLFSRDLALENDYLRQENRILRRKLGSRVPLSPETGVVETVSEAHPGQAAVPLRTGSAVSRLKLS